VDRVWCRRMTISKRNSPDRLGSCFRPMSSTMTRSGFRYRARILSSPAIASSFMNSRTTSKIDLYSTVKRLLDGRARLFDDYEDFERAIEVEVSSQFRTERPADKGLKMIESTIGEKRKKLDLILTGLSADNMDVANDLIRNLKREISGLEEQLRRKRELDRPRLALSTKNLHRMRHRFRREAPSRWIAQSPRPHPPV